MLGAAPGKCRRRAVAAVAARRQLLRADGFASVDLIDVALAFAPGTLEVGQARHERVAEQVAQPGGSGSLGGRW
jgi:hypothetical protein